MPAGVALNLTVPKLACGACVATVTTTIQTLDPEAQVSGDPSSKSVAIVLSPTYVSSKDHPEALVREALTAAGYPAD